MAFTRGGGGGFKKGNFGGFGKKGDVGKKGGFGKREGFGKKSFGGSRGVNRDSGEEREMFDAVCSECGKACQVPFKPSGKSGVLCSDCFKKSKGSDDDTSWKSHRRGGDERTISHGVQAPRNPHGTRTSMKERATVYTEANRVHDPRVDDLLREVAELKAHLAHLAQRVGGTALRKIVEAHDLKDVTD
jgi:CxxC-x17-CxxC domain-containing protein